MDLGIKGKRALVTGGSRGLGRQSALALANEGVDIAICARGKERLDATVEEISDTGVNSVGYALDMGDADAPAQVVDQMKADMGEPDIVVNNVGGSMGTSDVINSSVEDFAMVTDLNLFSAIRLIKLTLPGMQERGWGRIINISSIYGREAGGTAPYMVAKAGMIALSKHAALSSAPTGVTVNSVAPGSILFPGGSWERFREVNSQDFVDEFVARNLPMGKFGWPEPVGATVAFLASKHADLITGACINVDGGQSHNLF